MESTGLGDTIEKFTQATGIAGAVKLLFGENCGCERRKEFLNRIFKYEVECLTEEEYYYLDGIDLKKNIFLPEEYAQLDKIYKRVFSKNTKTCSNCWRAKFDSLYAVCIEYKNNRHTL